MNKNNLLLTGFIIYSVIELTLILRANPMLFKNDRLWSPSVTQRGFLVHHFSEEISKVPDLDTSQHFDRLEMAESGHSVRAYQKARRLWSFDRIVGEPFDPKFTRQNSDSVFVATGSGRIYRLDGATGQPLWIIQIKSSELSDLKIQGDKLVAQTTDQSLTFNTSNAIPIR